jgi:hypothetical protein
MKYTVVFLASFLISSSCFGLCNQIDAVTTASFKVVSGQACQDSASIVWNFTRQNGSMTIKWGTTKSYGSTGDLYAGGYTANTDQTFKFTGIQPGTKYYYSVRGLFAGATHNYTDSSFTTPVAASVSRPYTAGIHGNASVASAEVFTLSGKMILHTSQLQNLVGLKKGGPGMVIVRYRSSDSRVIAVQKICF